MHSPHLKKIWGFSLDRLPGYCGSIDKGLVETYVAQQAEGDGAVENGGQHGLGLGIIVGEDANSGSASAIFNLLAIGQYETDFLEGALVYHAVATAANPQDNGAAAAYRQAVVLWAKMRSCVTSCSTFLAAGMPPGGLG